MGLDMYLNRKVNVGSLKDSMALGKDDKKLKELSHNHEYNSVVLETEVGYWRKFNALHKYMVDNFGDEGNDNCRDFTMGIRDIAILRDKLQTLMERAELEEGWVGDGYTFAHIKKGEEVLLAKGATAIEKVKEGDIVSENKEEKKRTVIGEISWSEKLGCYTVQKLFQVWGRKIKNTEIFEDEFPTEEGFFFGSQDYDEWYIADIKKTIETLNVVIKEHDELVESGVAGGSIYYSYHAWY